MKTEISKPKLIGEFSLKGKKVQEFLALLDCIEITAASYDNLYFNFANDKLTLKTASDSFWGMQKIILQSDFFSTYSSWKQTEILVDVWDILKLRKLDRIRDMNFCFIQDIEHEKIKIRVHVGRNQKPACFLEFNLKSKDASDELWKIDVETLGMKNSYQIDAKKFLNVLEDMHNFYLRHEHEGNWKNQSISDIADEAADVLIVVEQLKTIFGSGFEHWLNLRIEAKLKRLQERLENAD
jgi:hypothetical protein